MLELKKYLDESKLTIKDFAKLLDYSPAYMGFIVAGKKLAGPRLAKDVEKLTDGKVKLPTKFREKKVKTHICDICKNQIKANINYQ